MRKDNQGRPRHGDSGSISGSEYEEVLSGVLKDQEERKRAEAAGAERQRRGRKGRGNQPLMLGILVMVSGYLWLGQPQFLEPAPLAPPPTELVEASLRFEMSIFIQRIHQYRERNGRLPSSLAEAYEPRPGFLYEPSGSSFVLIGTERETTLEYTSNQSVQEFLGDARQVIEQGVG